jgi:hypothetical protein
MVSFVGGVSGRSGWRSVQSGCTDRFPHEEMVYDGGAPELREGTE